MAEKYLSIPLDKVDSIIQEVMTKEEYLRRIGQSPQEPTPPPPSRPRDLFRGINESEALRLGLEKVELAGNPVAQDLLARIFDQTRTDRIDASTDAGAVTFIAAWKQALPNLPPPCTTDYKGYVRALQTGRIISNLDKNNPVIANPHFDKPSILWIENWQEGNFNDPAFQQTMSPLLIELGLGDKVVSISRTKVDAALWSGDPSLKQKTPQHTALVTKLGLEPKHYSFRLIAQDEYARLAASKNFGKSNLWTWFNDYQVVGESVLGLYGGYRDYGGASSVDYASLGYASGHLAVRLVLECNK